MASETEKLKENNAPPMYTCSRRDKDVCKDCICSTCLSSSCPYRLIRWEDECYSGRYRAVTVPTTYCGRYRRSITYEQKRPDNIATGSGK